MKDFMRTLIIGIIVLIIVVALYFIFFRTGQIPVIEEKEVQITQEELVIMAQDLFKEKQAEGMDMTNGPCLTNQLVPGWVVDVAHSPRQEVDNQPENQCSAFREGTAQHFIELDTEGNLIKLK